MSKNILQSAIILSIIVFLGYAQGASASVTEINSDINVATTWTKEGSPYVVIGAIGINAPLTIKPGTVIKLSKNPDLVGALMVNSSLIAIGTPSEKIIFTSTNDSKYGGDTSSYSAQASYPYPRRGDWSGIVLYDSAGSVKIENAILSYVSTAIANISISSTYYQELNIKNSEIKDNYVGLHLYNVESFLENNSIHHNNMGIRVYSYVSNNRTSKIKNSAIYNNGTSVFAGGYYYYHSFDIARLDARNNWWGDASGPYAQYFNLLGKGSQVAGELNMFYPWLTKEPIMGDTICENNCFSNVLFLPGIKASRLYKSGIAGSEDQLWLPNYFGNDIEELTLDEDGDSIYDVYTKDVLDEVPGGNIYKTFIANLSDLKNKKTINDYESFAYDWRQAVEDVAVNGTKYPSGVMKSVVAEVQTLAENSKSKKVTIVAHSNGGLVAKATMLELERLGLADKVDKIIFVGTPQMGTPSAMLAMLYGYEQAIPTLISRADARLLAENMPGSYGLLPSEKYFASMQDSFINFSSQQTRYKKFIEAYGENINSFSEFKNFLLGEGDGRVKPKKDDIEFENILNKKLLEQSQEIHQRLDNWAPPENIEAIQIAGWGLDTVSGVKYTEKERTQCNATPVSKIPSCVGMGEYEPVYEPYFTVDGDKIVVTPSALMLSDAENVNKYWVDLFEHNDNTIFDRDHKNLLEIDSVNEILNKIISNVDLGTTLPKYIHTARPDDYANAKPRLRMSLHSPLDIHLYDTAGHHTGPKEITDADGKKYIIFEENIPNSYYYQYGERKYVGFPSGENIKVEMNGYALGSYTLKLEEIQTTATGEKLLAHASFTDLPVTADTLVTFEIPEGGLNEMTALEADVDSDGTNDYTVERVANGTAELLLTVEMISQKIDQYAGLNFITDTKTQEFLQVKMRELAGIQKMIAKLDDKNNENPKANQIKLFNKKIDDLIDFIQNKFQQTILSPAQKTLIKNLKSIKL